MTEPPPAPRVEGGARGLRRGFVLLAFFLSGATSLAYEVAWTRGLLLLLGSTALASAIVLGAFVGALGFGAWWGGRRAERTSKPLALYGVLEIAAATWAFAALPLASLLEGPYVAIARDAGGLVRDLLRSTIAVLVVGPGAFLLGSTLPVLVRHWVRAPGAEGRGTALLYGVNTVGAVAGCLAAGFWGVEALGVRGLVAVAAGVAAAVGLVAWALGRGAAPVAADRLPVEGRLRSTLPLVVAFACGFVGLGVEVAGFRVLVFFLEGFTVTFAAMLAVFIAGLGLGSLAIGPLVAGTGRPGRAVAILLGTALLSAVLLPLFLLDHLQSIVVSLKSSLYAGVSDEAGIGRALRLLALLGSATLLFLPAFLLGATFPLCVRWAALQGLSPARAVGRVYLWNSLGTMVAPLLVTFLLVPAVGGEGLVRSSHVLRGREGRRLLAVKTDALTTASVVETEDGERILYTDDFAAAATGRHYPYMRMLGHLPTLFAREPKNALVIAFGTGTTAGAVAADPTVERLEVAEVSPAVLSLAPWFRDANRDVLADRRTRVVEDDGRNALLLHAPDLDVITLEPLMPYSPAGLPFYTREFYELARDRLRPGGVVCQWVPVHAMPAALYAALVRTFFEVFPDGSLWFFEQSTALLGWKGADRVSSDEVRRRFEARKADLSASGYPDLDALWGAFVASGRTVLDAPRPNLPWAETSVTDDRPYPEFHPTPRTNLLTSYLPDTLEYLVRLVKPGDRPPGAEDAGPRMRSGIQADLLARRQESYADFGAASQGMSLETLDALRSAAALYEKALTDLPGQGALTWRRARVMRSAARIEVFHLLALAASKPASSERGEILRRVERLATRAAELEDGDPVASQRWMARRLEAATLLHLGRCDSALRALDLAGVPPDVDPSVVADAKTAIARGDPRSAGDLLFPGLPGSNDLPACGPDGVELVRAELDRYQAALERGDDLRRARLAARALEEAARAQGVQDVLSRDVALRPRGVLSVVDAGLRLGLAGETGALRSMLLHEDPEIRAAAVEECVERKALRRFPEAAGLLLDEERAVRVAAAAAWFTVLPDVMKDYDPDADEATRRAVVDRVRAAP